MTELKQHLADDHQIVEAFDGISVSDDQIVYGRSRSPELIVAIHDMDHERGVTAGRTHSHN